MLNAIRNELPAEVPLGKETIVCRAEDSKLLGRLAATARPRLFVMDLREPGRAATLSTAPDERATQAIPCRDLPLRAVRDVAAAGSARPRVASVASEHLLVLRPSFVTGLLGLGKAGFQRALDQQVERAFDHAR